MKRLIIAASLGLLALSARAVDMAVPAAEVHARLQQADQKMLFVDVRDPVEIMFVGFTDAVHVNVPFLVVDRSAWDDKRGVYKLALNELADILFQGDIRARPKSYVLPRHAPASSGA